MFNPLSMLVKIRTWTVSLYTSTVRKKAQGVKSSIPSLVWLVDGIDIPGWFDLNLHNIVRAYCLSEFLAYRCVGLTFCWRR